MQSGLVYKTRPLFFGYSCHFISPFPDTIQAEPTCVSQEFFNYANSAQLIILLYDIYLTMDKKQELILCIPGNWKDRSAIVQAIASANMNEYLFAGAVLMHLPTSDAFEMDIQPHDERMRHAFEVSGQGRLDEDELDAIAEHQFVIYVIGKGGNFVDAQKTMQAGLAILNAGGLGIKVENSGKAFTIDHWKEMVEDETDDGKFYEAFVMFLKNEEGSIYSCGMHNVGLRDVICDADMEINDAVELIRIFIFYLLIDQPTILSGQTFSKDKASPVYRIFEEECTEYEADDLFFNSFGMYHLQAI